MRIRFQAYADLNEDIVTGVLRREPGVDFQTATEAGLRGLEDAQVLSLAARNERILISHDRKTMPGHFAEFIRTNVSPGVFIVSQKLDLLSAVEDLLLIWGASDSTEWTNLICTIPF